MVWQMYFKIILIEKVHLDDLDVYLDMLKMQIFLWSSALKLAKKFNWSLTELNFFASFNVDD